MLGRLTVFFVVVALSSAVLFAHGAGVHVTGTVTAMDAAANTVTVLDGKQSTVVLLNAKTVYLRDKKAAARTDLKVGLRVVIDVETDAKTKKYFATEVQIGVADAAAAKPVATATKPAAGK